MPSPKSWGVRSPHCRPRFALYSTYWSSKLQLTRAKSTSTRLFDLPHLLLRKPKKSHAWFSLVIGIWTAVSRTPHPTSAKGRHLQKIINKNNEITIIQYQRADCSAPLQPSGSVIVHEYMSVFKKTFYETSNYIVFSGCATSLFLNSLDIRRNSVVQVTGTRFSTQQLIKRPQKALCCTRSRIRSNSVQQSARCGNGQSSVCAVGARVTGSIRLMHHW